MFRRRDTADFIPRGVAAPKVREEPRAPTLVGSRVFRADDGLVVVVPHAILQRLIAFARASAPKEWLGFIATSRLEDDEGPYVVVQGIVPDTDAIRHATSVHTTPDSEYRARSLLFALYPDAVPGGWTHSHPNLGLTYSHQDRLNQATWTDLDSLGIVIDPWSDRKLAVYRGPRAELLYEHEPPPHASLRAPATQPFSPRIVTPEIETNADEPRELATSPFRPRPPRRPRSWGPLAATLVTAGILFIAAAHAEHRADTLDRRIREMEHTIEAHAAELADLTEQHTTLVEMLCAGTPENAGPEVPAWCPIETP